MAIFKVVNTEQLDADLANIASAIKAKSGINESLVFPNGFIEAVNDITVGDEETQEAIKKAKTHDWIQEHFFNYKKTVQCNLFASNPNITEIPEFDFSQIVNFYKMFYNCSSLTRIPNINTSSGENFAEMFRGCTSLLEIPPLNTSKAIDMRRMFNNYRGEIPWIIDTTNTTTLESTFEGCTNATSITLTSTKNCTNFFRTFTSCANLETVSILDLQNGENITNMFLYCGKIKNIDFEPESIKLSIVITSPMLTIGNVENLNDTENRGSVQNIINGLAILAEGAAAQTLTLSKNLPLTDEQKQAITTAVNNKGWTLAFA